MSTLGVGAVRLSDRLEGGITENRKK